MDTRANPLNYAAALGLVEITAEKLLAHIADGIRIGSGGARLAWSQFEFEVNSSAPDTLPDDVEGLVKAGMPLLDAVVYLEADNRPPGVTISRRDEDDNVIQDFDGCCRGLFALYFALFTQGRSDPQGAPNFLVAVLGFGGDFSELIKGLSSAPITGFPTGWVKNVSLDNLSEKSKNRLALGAAGHRYISALRYIRPGDWKAGKEANESYVAALLEWSDRRVWWDLHPLYKSGPVITATGSLNKTIEDCLADGLSDAGATRLVTARILHHVPIAQPAHATWDVSDPSSYPALTTAIF
jgi:hypothetical protein